jgi:hypothetical protein
LPDIPFHIPTPLLFPGIIPLLFSLSAKPFLVTEVSPAGFVLLRPYRQVLALPRNMCHHSAAAAGLMAAGQQDPERLVAAMSTGNGFHPVTGSTQVSPGASAMAAPGASAQIAHSDGRLIR